MALVKALMVRLVLWHSLYLLHFDKELTGAKLLPAFAMNYPLI